VPAAIGGDAQPLAAFATSGLLRQLVKIREAKRLVTLHGGGPTPADYNESAAAFYGKQPWPGTTARFPKLLELGSSRHSDLELNFG
jgi:hypothetical protein